MLGRNACKGGASTEEKKSGGARRELGLGGGGGGRRFRGNHETGCKQGATAALEREFGVRALLSLSVLDPALAWDVCFIYLYLFIVVLSA